MKHALKIIAVVTLALCCTAGKRWVPWKNAGSSSSLLNDLAAYWTLDETTGTRADSTANAQTLSETGTVAYAAAKVSNGADIESGTAAYLSAADSATLSLGTDTDFTISCWVNIESLSPFTEGIISKASDEGNGVEYELILASGGFPEDFRFRVGNGSSSQTVSNTTPSTATWYHLVAYHDAATNEIGLIVNNGTPATAAWSGGTQDAGNTLHIGTMGSNTGKRCDGIIDEVGFWKRKLTAGEITSLYNSGSGTTHPF